ncbi:heat stress transcription factor A-6B, putative [Entamoeba invadens IP1]|uniref:Heat stress transcription factor A-6B, putative n=1 Tax=Entamoeba invadens IP1 TaxID=370355 RepID=A0A0A1U2P0_ENTIV|nr:heat stress transcription factor A-6B, putative [Entamoeba invadens IP1]ELP86923.1 heat stress transcription factor A-6B, putative [Entamoeba invadens IP1]|eukprot:XP_004253694.1 heat stress transcription factor A-6B, putative [Entamoeba invadens IP1]
MEREFNDDEMDGQQFDDQFEKDERENTRGTIVSFVSILYQMVDLKDNDRYIRWSSKDSGHSFEIVDPVAFSKEILPKYYKHTNFCGFTRQLTLYGFKKVCINNAFQSNNYKQTEDEYRFQHESFVQGHMELLKNIQRKKPASQRKKQNNTTVLYQQLLTQLVQLQKQNIDTLTQINTLKEMLYQLKLREDSLELKMQRLQETFMPNPASFAFGFNMMGNDMPQFNVPQSMNDDQTQQTAQADAQNQNTTSTNQTHDTQPPSFGGWGDQASQLQWKF